MKYLPPHEETVRANLADVDHKKRDEAIEAWDVEYLPPHEEVYSRDSANQNTEVEGKVAAAFEA